jgi:chromate transporter
MSKLKSVLSLFLAFFKIGLFTFGGGYAMIAVIERELVEKKKWIEHEEFMDVIAIAESTPGPLAINSATYIGYKVCGFFGSLFATLGVVLPSFIIVFVISLFFDAFLQLEYVRYAFNGIQACVAFLILSAGIKMFKALKKTLISVVLFSLTTACLIAFSLFAINFSSIIYILVGGVVGLTVYLVQYFKQKAKEKGNEKTGEDGE